MTTYNHEETDIIRYREELQAKNLELTRAIEDLSRTKDMLLQQEKLASIGQLAAGVAHEINNPLSGILGNSQMLMSKIPADNPLYEFIKKIERAAIRCRDIVSDLLDFSRKEDHETQKISINKMLEDVFVLCETEIMSQNIKIEKKYSPDLPEISVSIRKMQHAVLNIINNAMQAIPDRGGRITISTGIKKIEKKDYIEIEIEDNGCGFSKEVSGHIFDPFFTTREVGKGTGLGLSLTYSIIKNHSGFIKGSSPGSGMGSVFTIQLPIFNSKY